MLQDARTAAREVAIRLFSEADGDHDRAFNRLAEAYQQDPALQAQAAVWFQYAIGMELQNLWRIPRQNLAVRVGWDEGEMVAVEPTEHRDAPSGGKPNLYARAAAIARPDNLMEYPMADGRAFGDWTKAELRIWAKRCLSAALTTAVRARWVLRVCDLMKRDDDTPRKALELADLQRLMDRVKRDGLIQLSGAENRALLAPA